ncbi:MAG: undecaprenyl-diphosphate phosphatase [Candidatus Marinimicrobia bacterium]|nr:undecaprenyl-diphosphate phosphatase [Candidatus Neomarinimicrobiota bacterium]
MTLNESVWLGVLQGLTEFLPVSSSGHLVIMQKILGIEESGIAFEIFVHFGTLLSIIVMFRKDVIELSGSLFRALRSPGNLRRKYMEDKRFRMLSVILLATVPAGIVGVLFKSSFERFFNDTNFVGYAFLVTGMILFVTKFAVEKTSEVRSGRAFIIGAAQAFAIFPGISRSGSTISAAMLSGVSGEEAARFSFLLAIPAIGGATLLQLTELIGNGYGSINMTVSGAGILSSFLTGSAAIWILMRIIRRGKIHYFSWYCFSAGIATLIII